MTETILVPGGRDVRATLDRAREDGADGTDDAADRVDTVVVACPPHPQHQGHRGDARLVAVSDALTARGADCLRFDYGPWDEGYGERADTLRAVEWAAERYDRVGLFGFSFGGAMALLAA
ncbi:alpha/beta hydrolase, partial [Haloferax sp. AB510]|nr:alpha/beta hydrolase [Haloferax sp. AB510]